MPVLKNPKHEQFAKHIVNGLKQVDAYEAAGYPRSPSSASQLENKPEVQDRIQELVSEQQARAGEIEDDIDNLPDELTRDWLVKTLMKNVQLAQKVGQIAPANKAVEMLAELIGYSFKKPGAALPKEGDEPGKDETADVNIDKMSDGMGKLGAILAEREQRASEAKE
jgi:hypothetical protein